MLNKACLLGNVGKDPEIRTTQSGDKIASFSIATSESWKGKDGSKQEKTEWHRISVFGTLALVVEKYVTKGSTVYVEGKIQTRDYTDKDGVKRYSTEIVLSGYNSVLKLCGGRGDKPTAETMTRPQQPVDGLDDEIPF